MTTVAVIGAGAVGARVVRQLVETADDEPVQLASRRLVTAFHLAERHPGRVRVVDVDQAVTADVVVLATPRPQHRLASAALRAKANVVTTSDDPEDCRLLLSLAARATLNGRSLVVGAGLAPGLSGLLTRHLVDGLDEPDEVHISVHGTAGPACARRHHRALGGTAVAWHDGRWEGRPGGSGRELCWFPGSVGAKDCYRADLGDPFLLRTVLSEPSRISARLSATRRDRLTARLPMLTPPHTEGGIGALRVEVRGSRAGERVVEVAGVSERVGIVAGAVAASFAHRLMVGSLPAGRVVAGDHRLPTSSLLRELDDRGIHLQSYVGSAASTIW